MGPFHAGHHGHAAGNEGLAAWGEYFSVCQQMVRMFAEPGLPVALLHTTQPVLWCAQAICAVGL